MLGYVTIVEVPASGGYRWYFTVRVTEGCQAGTEEIIKDGFGIDKKEAAKAAYRFAFEWEMRR